jgi:hypothetical protein
MADIHMTPPVMSVTPAMKMAVSAGVIVHMGPPQIVWVNWKRMASNNWQIVNL